MAKKTASKAVKKLQKKIGTAGMVLTILALVIGIAIGAVLAYSKTGKDDFYLAGDKDIIIAGKTVAFSLSKLELFGFGAILYIKR